MDERFRGFQNRQRDLHMRDTDPSPRRMGARGLTIVLAIVAVASVALVIAFTR